MFNFISKRLTQSVIVLFGVTIVCFVIFQYLGDPALTIAGYDATEEQLEEIRRDLGLYEPLYVQYGRFLARTVQGDFGISYLSHTPVLPMVLERIPATLELALSAMLIATSLALIIGVYAAMRPHTTLTNLAMLGTLGGISMPTFLTGILMIYVFSITLQVLPPFGRGELIEITSWWSTGFLTWDGIKHLFMPAATLGFFQVAMSTRVVRGEMQEVLLYDYIRTARAKGLTEMQVTLRHALKNALIPFVTMVGLQLGSVIAFAMVVETVFQWPGMGMLIINSITGNDQPVVVTYIMVIAVMFVLINLIVDILYCVLNPRIAYDK